MGRRSLIGLTATVTAFAAASASLGGPVTTFQSADHQASVTLSSTKAGADDVTLTVRLPAELRCGHPMGAALVVTFPAATQLPASIHAADVRVNKKAPAKVSLSGHVVTVAMPGVHGIMCNSIVDGTLDVAFSSQAAIGNPAKAGTYTVDLRRGSESNSVAVRIQ